MRLTIIPNDKVVIKDGLALHGLNFTFVQSEFEGPPLDDVHAVQWYEDHGEVEYNDNKRNEVFFNIAPFQNIIDIYNAEKARLEAEAIEAAKLTWDKIRGVRDQCLKDSDWTQLLDAPIDVIKQEAFAAYREDLRNVPQTHSAEDLTKYKDTKDFKEKKFPKEPK